MEARAHEAPSNVDFFGQALRDNLDKLVSIEGPPGQFASGILKNWDDREVYLTHANTGDKVVQRAQIVGIRTDDSDVGEFSG